ncbi:MAG: CapA family protein [Chloroflexota bacterium]|nr:CapA family protein [Chloroflexota bacterium]
MPDYRLALTGDSLITRPLSTIADDDLAALKRLIGSVDFAFTNLEFIAAHPPFVPRPRWNGLHVYAAATVLDELKDLGFNLFSLAHNHTMDYSGGGLLQTLQAIGERQMVAAGAGTTLTQARRPHYLDRSGYRASIIAACATEADQTIACDPDGMVDGRPGLSGLRYATRYELLPRQYQALSEIDEALGTAEGTRQAEALSLTLDPDAAKKKTVRSFRFLGSRFVEGSSAKIERHPNKLDVDDICRWIHDARRQSDLVVVSLHCHEGAHGQYNADNVAEFAIEAAKTFIDAGADVFAGHGPHQLAAMEMYRGKPIFHSLGNFAFMVETVETVPEEFLLAAGLPPRSTGSDFQDMREGPERGAKGFSGATAFWEAVIPVCGFGDGRIASIELWPIVLWLGPSRARRGVPAMAPKAEGKKILERFAHLSEPFGTKIALDERDGRTIGHVVLDSA